MFRRLLDDGVGEDGHRLGVERARRAWGRVRVEGRGRRLRARGFDRGRGDGIGGCAVVVVVLDLDGVEEDGLFALGELEERRGGC